MSTEEKIRKIGGLKNLTEVCIANEYGLDAVVEFRKDNSLDGFIANCKSRSAEAVKKIKGDSRSGKKNKRGRVNCPTF